MATQKRGKLRRLPDPATTSRQQPLGSISTPVNQNFRVRIPKPKLRPVTDFSKLSATIAEGLAIEGITQGKEDQKKQRTEAKKWHLENRKLSKSLTTLAKAVAAGHLPATTTEIFWQQLSIERGKSRMYTFRDEILPKYVAKYSSPTRQETPDEVRGAFLGLFREHVTDPLENNAFALRTVMDMQGDLESKWLGLVNNAYNKQQESQLQTLAIGNAATGLMAAFTEQDNPNVGSLEFKTAADVIAEQWRGLSYAPLGQMAKQEATARVGFIVIDRLDYAGPDPSTQDRKWQTENALKAARNMMGEGIPGKRGMVWGTPETGYKSVYKGGKNETAMLEKIAVLERKLERLDAKEGTDREDQKEEISDLTNVMELPLVEAYNANSDAGQQLITSMAKVDPDGDGNYSHDDLKTAFAEVLPDFAWTEDMTKSVNKYPGGFGLLLGKLRGKIHLMETTLPSDNDEALIAKMNGLRANRMYGAMLALANDPETKVRPKLRSQWVKEFQTLLDIEPRLNKATEGVVKITTAYRARAKDDRKLSLQGETLKLVDGIRTELVEVVEKELTAYREDETQSWDDRSILKWLEEQPAIILLRDRFDEAVKDGLEAQQVKTDEYLNNARLGKDLDEAQFQRDSDAGLIVTGTLTAIGRLKQGGSDAKNWLAKKKAVIEADLRRRKDLLVEGGLDEASANSRYDDARKAVEKEFDDKFMAEMLSWDEWDIDRANAYYRANRQDIVDKSNDVFQGIVSRPLSTEEKTTASHRSALLIKQARGLQPGQNAANRFDLLNSSEGRKLSAEEQAFLIHTKGDVGAIIGKTHTLDASKIIENDVANWNTGEDGLSLFINWIETRLDPNAVFPKTFKYQFDPSGKPIPRSGGTDPSFASFDLTDKQLGSLEKQRGFFTGGRGTVTGSRGRITRFGEAASTESISVDPTIFRDFAKNVITDDYVNSRTMRLTPEFLKAIKDGTAPFHMVLLDRFRSGQLLGPTIVGEGEETVRPLQLGPLTGKWKRTVQFFGGGPSRATYELVDGNGNEAFRSVVTTGQFAALQNKNFSEMEKLEKAQQLQSLKKVSLQSVVDGELTISQNVRAEGEWNTNPGGHPTWDKDYRTYSNGHRNWGSGAVNDAYTLYLGRINHGTIDAEDAVRVNMRVVTSVTIPFQKPGGEVLDWISPVNTRNFQSVAQCRKELIVGQFQSNGVTLNVMTDGMFTIGSMPYRYLEKLGLAQTPKNTASYIKSQLELAAMVDPKHDKEMFQADRAAMSQVLGR